MTTDSSRLASRPATADELVRYHTRHKLLLMAHAPAAVGVLGRLVARSGGGDLDDIWRQYDEKFRATLAQSPSRGAHVNALLHAVGYFRGVVADTDRRGIVRSIELYAAGACSLASPMRIIRAHAEQHAIQYLLDQVYLRSAADFDDR
jgi:uncharacterized protein YbgA (DUF1722 family)